MRADITPETRRIKNYKNRDKSTEAEERKAESKNKSNAAQIKRLDDRLGVGIGAARERQRLMT